jgi:hypothetical protein
MLSIHKTTYEHNFVMGTLIRDGRDGKIDTKNDKIQFHINSILIRFDSI